MSENAIPVETGNEDALICVTQELLIEEQLARVKDAWEKWARDMESLAATEDNKQTIKKLRADMRRKHSALLERKRIALAPTMERIERFNGIFNECVEAAFLRADQSAKDKIASIEGAQKAACEKRLRAYFAELCSANGLDWLTYERAEIKVDMASATQKTPKKLMATLKSFVEAVSENVRAISAMEDAPDIMAEYKQSLNLSGAIQTVKERKRRADAERDALAAGEEARRRADEAEEMVEQAAEVPAVLAPPEQKETVFESFTFTVKHVTKAQLIEIRDYLRRQGIEYV